MWRTSHRPRAEVGSRNPDPDRGNAYAQEARQLANQPLHKQRTGAVLLVEHGAACKYEPAAAAQQRNQSRDEAREPIRLAVSLIGQYGIDAGENNVGAETPERRSVAAVADQELRARRNDTQLRDRCRQQQVIAQIATTEIAR